METDVFLFAGIPKRITLLMRKRGNWKKKKKKKAMPRGKTAVGLLFDDLLETKCSVGTIEKDIPLWRIAFPNVSQAADSRYIFSI